MAIENQYEDLPEEQGNLNKNVLETDHQMPRAEEGNIGNQSECTSLVREHSRQKISSDAFIVERGYSQNRKVPHRAPAPADNILVIQDLSSPSMTLFRHSHSPTSS